MVTKRSNLGRLADELGDLKSEIARLTERERDIKAELKAAGITPVEGERFRVTVSETVAWQLDTALVKETMGEQWVMAHSKPSPRTCVRVVARTRKE